MGRPHAFEKGEKLYLTTPLVLTRPTQGQVEEFAFASAVKTKAPNENIGWLQGRYAEAERANLNGAMWLNDELALKSMTPMLMPVTVMHDPRTAVGTIADCKFLAENGSARIETILGIWRHRFPDIWEEAEADIQRGQMMQSMETFAPWYSCSECDQAFVKLPHGAERASWCDHLRGDSSSKGWRILRDTCFTGTGLIFGSRGGVGAYTEAQLDHFHDEIAEFHERAHVDSSYRPRSESQMGMISIEESELATLRRERDEAKRRNDELAESSRGLTVKVETAEAAQKRAETERDAEKGERTKLEEQAQRTQRAKGRMDNLGAGFLGKLGDTSRAVLSELAAAATDEQWDLALREREELAGVKRDAPPANKPPESGSSESFSNDEVASFLGRVAPANGGGAPPAQDGATSVRQLARAFASKGK
jgi:hypothetical protein